MNDWLISTLGESAAKFVWFTLLFIIFIIAAFLIVRLISQLSKGNSNDSRHHRQSEPVMRLGVIDSAIIDEARKLILVRRDNTEHLLLIGGPNDLVVESYPCQEAAQFDYSPSQINEDQIERYSSNQDYGYLDEDTFSQSTPVDHAASVSGADQDNSTISHGNKDEPRSVTHISASQQPPAVQMPRDNEISRNQNYEPLSSNDQSRAEPHSLDVPEVAHTYSSSNAPVSENTASQPYAGAVSQANANEQTPAKKANTAQVHPVYPLGQVSRAVIEASTQYASKYRTPEMPIPATIVQPTPSRVSTAPSAEKRVAPAAPVIPETIAENPQLNTDFAASDDNNITTEFLSEIEIDFGDAFTIESLETQDPKSDEQTFDLGGNFEDELLASLDISPAQNSSQPSFEDEMERLLSDLTPGKKN